MDKENVLILGFGRLGERLAASLTATGRYCVTGVCRRQKQSSHAEILSADCRDEKMLVPIMARGFDVLVMTFTPDTMTDEGYRQSYVETVKALLAALASVCRSPRLILFVSSTSVYGQQEGHWVDESSPTVPQHFSGRRLLQAEHLLTMSSRETCIVRCSGIYGPGRNRLIEQVIAGQGGETEATTISNRIHIDDCAGAITHLINKQRQAPLADCYVLSDCEPTPLWEVKQWLARMLGLPSDHFRADGGDIVDDAKKNKRSGGLRGNKRCCNRRLLSSGYHFLYPSFREGYQSLLSNAGPTTK